MNDSVFNKRTSIERCVTQARVYFADRDSLTFETDSLRQDAIAMNAQRACELSIDLANHTSKTKKLGLPDSSRDTFTILGREGIIPVELAGRLEKMVGFRNILVHDYRQINVAVLVDTVENRLDDLLEFSERIFRTFGGK